MIDERKNIQTIPTRTYCKRSRPLPYTSKVVGRPGTGSLPSTITPPDPPPPPPNQAMLCAVCARIVGTRSIRMEVH